MPLLVFITTLFFLLSPPSEASASAFDRWLSWDGLTASFTQLEYDTGGALIRMSEGNLTLQRPSYALWKVHTPDPQEFYASAQGVWHYDPWLEVATFHPSEADSNQSTLALFSGSKSALEERFIVAEIDNQLLFTPRERDAQIASVRLTLSTEGYPRTIELRTNLGHRTLIELNETQAGDFAADIFAFTPPAGTEIQ